MSVGLQRLREDADAVRKGALDKGEDAGVVDEALALDEQRRRLLGAADGLKAERNRISREIGERISAGSDPKGAEVAEVRARATELGERIDALDA